jgi:hypothetical protein
MWYRRGAGEHQALAGVGVSDAGGLAHAANVLLTDRISVVSMATAPGHSIDIGGSMYDRRSDPATGVGAHKLYIGKVGIVDISLSHSRRWPATPCRCCMSVLVSSVIGHSL